MEKQSLHSSMCCLAQGMQYSVCTRSKQNKKEGRGKKKKIEKRGRRKRTQNRRKKKKARARQERLKYIDGPIILFASRMLVCCVFKDIVDSWVASWGHEGVVHNH